MRYFHFPFSYLILASSLLGASSLADTVTTPFHIELSKPSTLTLLGGVDGFKAPAGEMKTDLPDQHLITPNTVDISGIHLTLDYLFNTPVASGQLNEWSIQSKMITAGIVVDAISTTQTVVIQNGGTTLTLNVTASCNDVHLALIPGSTEMDARVILGLANNRTSFTLSDFKASWAPASWQVTSLNCNGPNGFPEEVKQAIITQLSSIDPFLPSIQTEIANQLNAQAGPVSWTMAANSDSGMSLKLTPDQMQILADGSALVSGTADFGFAKLANTACSTLITDTSRAPNATDSLSIPISAIEALVKCAYLNGTVTASFTSLQFSAFQSLLGSWFKKVFVWPNLVKFNSQSIFDFRLSPTAAPEIGPMSGKNGQIQFNLKVPMILQMDAPETAGPIHYMDFQTELNGLTTLSLQKGIVAFKQSTNNLTVTNQWADVYVNTYHPDERVSTSTMAGILQKYLANTGATYTLPTFIAPGAFSLGVDSASVSGSDATISLKIKTLSSP